MSATKARRSDDDDDVHVTHSSDRLLSNFSAHKAPRALPLNTPPLKSSQGGGVGGIQRIEHKNVGQILFWVLGTAFMSISLTLGNKAILRAWEWPLTLMALQNGWATLFGCISVLSGAPFERTNMRQIASLAVTATMTATCTATILIALPRCSIATLTVFGSAKALVSAAVEGVCCRAKFGAAELACLALIFAAGLFYGITDTTTTMLGYLFLGVNLFISVSRGVVQRWTYTTMRQSVIGIAFIESALAFPLVCALCFFSGEWRVDEQSIVRGHASGFADGLLKPWRAWNESVRLSLPLPLPLLAMPLF